MQQSHTPDSGNEVRLGVLKFLNLQPQCTDFDIHKADDKHQPQNNSCLHLWIYANCYSVARMSCSWFPSPWPSAIDAFSSVSGICHYWKAQLGMLTTVYSPITLLTRQHNMMASYKWDGMVPACVADACSCACTLPSYGSYRRYGSIVTFVVRPHNHIASDTIWMRVSNYMKSCSFLV